MDQPERRAHLYAPPLPSYPPAIQPANQGTVGRWYSRVRSKVAVAALDAGGYWTLLSLTLPRKCLSFNFILPQIASTRQMMFHYKIILLFAVNVAPAPVEELY